MRYKVSSPPQLWGQDSAYSVPAKKKKKNKSLLPVDLNTYKGNIEWRFLVQACRSTWMETLEMNHYSFFGMLFLLTYTLCMIWFWWVLACAIFFFFNVKHHSYPCKTTLQCHAWWGYQTVSVGEQGWHIGENPILLTMWPGLEFWHHKSAKFVVQFLLCLKHFSLGFSVFILQQKSTLPDSNLILKQ